MVASNTRQVEVEVVVVKRHADGRETVSYRDLLPWADPYIAGLVQKVKSQILADRGTLDPPCPPAHPRAEAAPPLTSSDLEFELPLRDPWLDVEDR